MLQGNAWVSMCLNCTEKKHRIYGSAVCDECCQQGVAVFVTNVTLENSKPGRNVQLK